MKPVSLTQKTGKLSNGFKFLIVIVCGGAALLLFGALFIVLGAERLTLQDVIKGLFRYDETDFNDVIVRDIRLPRLLADVVVGASLALAGAIMQGNTKNPMADSGLMGVSSGSVFAIIVAMAFMPNISRLERMGISCLGAGVATLLVYGIAMIGRRGHTAERMVLSGMAISTLFSSVTTGIVLKEGLSGELMKYTAGSSASTIWLDIRVAGPFFIAGVLLSLVIARSLTVMNLGEDVSTGLGANVKLIKLTSTVIVLVLSALAVIVIGPVGYIGLMIPHIVRPIVGTDYRYVLPASAVLGALLVVVVDIIARIVIAPLEFPGNKTRFSPLKRGVIVNIILWVLLLTTFLLGCNTGRFAMSVREVFVTLFGGGTREMNLALFTYRLPRVCLAILVGLGMGVSGVVMQDLLHNNLASPGTLGVSAGSGLFVTLYVALLRTQSNNAVLMPVLALGGGLLSAGLIFLLGTKRKQALQPTRLIMTGVALSSAYSAVSTFLMLILDENQMEFLQRWQSGELWGTDWKYVTVLAIWIAVFGLLTFRGGMTLNVINIGYDVARGLGVNVGRQFVFLSFCAVALSSSAVAFGGNFFFLGLIGPHIARKLVGTDARVLMPAADAAAGIIVLLADILVKSLDFLAGIPTGIVVSVISVPYFLYLLVRK